MKSRNGCPEGPIDAGQAGHETTDERTEEVDHYPLPAHLERHAANMTSDIRGQLSEAERLARLTEAHRLHAMADGMGLSPNSWQPWLARIHQTLNALPAKKLEAERAQLQSMLAAASDNRELARGYQQRLTELERDNPQPTKDQVADAQRLIDAHTAAAKVGKASGRKLVRDPVTGAVTTADKRAAPLTRIQAPDMIFKARATRP